MAHAERVDDHIVINTGFNEKELVRMIPGAGWKPALSAWTAPLSWASCKIMRGVFRDSLTVGPELAAWSWNEMDKRINPSLALRMETDVDFLDDVQSRSGWKLFPYQRAGCKFLTVARQALLADEMGTGKTIQTISALRGLKQQGEQPFPALIIAPNSMKLTWLKEFKEWYPELVVIAVSGSAAQRRKLLEQKAHVYIMNWESVMLHSRLAPYGSVALKKCTDHGGSDPKVTEAKCEVHHKELNKIAFKTVVCDEAHKMKSPQTKQTRGVWAVGHQPSVEFRFALTGTPIANDPGDLWSLMHFIDPKEYPTRTKFIDRYALMSWNAFGGMDIIGVRPETKDEFYEVLDPRFRRMPKSLVLPFLPPKIPITRYAPMTAKQEKAYDQMVSGLIAKIDEGLILSTNPLTQMLRLIQFSSAYATLDETVDETTGAITAKVRLALPSNKIDELLEVIDDLPKGEPLVVMAASRQLIMLADEVLREKHIKTCLIVGGLTPDQRQNAIEDFQAGRVQIILCTIAAGGVGLTLTRAQNIVFLQRSWSMLENKQAIDRVHRIGSEVHESINVIDIVAPGTVEEKQIMVLRQKEARLEEIVRDKETLMNELLTESDPERRALLEKRMKELDERLAQPADEWNFSDPNIMRKLLEDDDDE